MNLNIVLPFLAVLICPIVMGIMMWKMNKNMDDHHKDMTSKDAPPASPQKKIP